jgi:hypothetical protein
MNNNEFGISMTEGSNVREISQDDWENKDNNNSVIMKEKRKRNRKSPRKTKLMMDALINDPDWSKETCSKVAFLTGLSES